MASHPRLGVVFESVLHCAPLTARGWPDLSCEAPARTIGALVKLRLFHDIVIYPVRRVAGGTYGVRAWLLGQALLYFAPLRDPNEGDALAHAFVQHCDVHVQRPYHLDHVIETTDALIRLAAGYSIDIEAVRAEAAAMAVGQQRDGT